MIPIHCLVFSKLPWAFILFPPKTEIVTLTKAHSATHRTRGDFAYHLPLPYFIS